MQAVLYISHGSRMNEATKQASQFLKQVMHQVPVPIQEISFLELSDPSVIKGVERCMQRGATTIHVIPFLLLTATHVKKDIPELIMQLKHTYPQIAFHYGHPLGIHEKLTHVLLERIAEKRADDHEVDVLLIGRGSSDAEQICDFKQIAAMLSAKPGIRSVDTCFLVQAKPSIEDALRAAHERNRPVFVVPYLLFTGILMKSIEKLVQSYNEDGGKFVLCDYLGLHPFVQEVLAQRVAECLNPQHVLAY